MKSSYSNSCLAGCKVLLLIGSYLISEVLFPSAASAATVAPGISQLNPVGGGVALVETRDFPRLMGMNIASDNFHIPAYQADLARLNVVILGFYPGWNKIKSLQPIRDAVRAIKILNPQILIGNYTILNEAQGSEPRYAMYRDKAFKLDKENWWLRKADGNKTQWTDKYDAWDINITEWTTPDFNNMRYPEWLADRDYRFFFGLVPEFDIWYFDNVMDYQRVEKADWDLDGQDDLGKSPRIEAAFQLGMAAHWAHARKLSANLLFMGNTNNDLSSPIYVNQLQGAFLEGLMGRTWSLETWAGWGKMMERYNKVFSNLASPKLVGFNVHGKLGDYRFFRYAFTSCLLNDGYFSFTDEKQGYSSVPWFDEYDFKLGKAISPPQTRPWKDNVYRRDFTQGIILVNPGQTPANVTIEAGFRHLKGAQAPLINDGQSVRQISIPPRDGLVLVRGN